MKRFLCMLLAFVLTLSCSCLIISGSENKMIANASGFETENGVKVEMAPFLYKSKLYQMEFPSRDSYSVKEKSAEGCACTA